MDGMRTEKLETLAQEHGVSVGELVEEYVLEDVVPGICMNEGCVYTAQYEPDQDGGWCEHCEMRSVASALILAGMI